jgi:hypothetical protein
MGRNRGACNSLGNVLIFLNADTFINDPDSFFDKALEILKNDSIAAIACNVSVFPEEEKISDYLFHKFYNSYCFILNKFFIGMGRGECHIVKRDLFFKIKGYDESLSAGEDFDLYKRLRKLGKIHFNFNLKVFESPRRYRKYGYFRVVGDWLKNSIWVMLFKKSSSESWEPVR